MDSDLFNNEIERIEEGIYQSILFLSTLNPRLPIGKTQKELLYKQLESIDKTLEVLIQSLEKDV